MYFWWEIFKSHQNLRLNSLTIPIFLTKNDDLFKIFWISYVRKCSRIIILSKYTPTWSSWDCIQSKVYAFAGVSVLSNPQSISCEPIIAITSPASWLSNNWLIVGANVNKVRPIMAIILSAMRNGRRRPSFDSHLKMLFYFFEWI